jgi:hypothetical protein
METATEAGVQDQQAFAAGSRLGFDRLHKAPAYTSTLSRGMHEDGADLTPAQTCGPHDGVAIHGHKYHALFREIA